jgi:hypothetical protein
MYHPRSIFCTWDVFGATYYDNAKSRKKVFDAQFCYEKNSFSNLFLKPRELQLPIYTQEVFCTFLEQPTLSIFN